MTITREQLLEKRNELISKLAVLKSKDFNYVILRNFMQFGCVVEMRQDALIQAFTKLKSFNKDFSESLEELGFKQEDSKENKPIHAGYSYEEWKKEFLLRAEEIRNEDLIEKLKVAIEIVEKNLSDDDKFKIDMENLSNILGE